MPDLNVSVILGDYAYDLLVGMRERGSSMEVKDCIDMIRRGEYGRAIWHLSRMDLPEPDYATAEVLKGLALYKLGRYPKAIEACEVAVMCCDDMCSEADDLIDEFVHLKRHGEAFVYHGRIIEMNNEISRAQYVMAKTLFRMGKMDDALEWLSEVLDLDPDNPDERSNLKAILGETCHEEDLDSPGELSIEHMRGGIFRDFWHHHEKYQKSLKEKLDRVNSYVNTHHDETGAHVARAKTLFRLDDFPRALEAIDRALSLDPLNARNHYLKADILYMLGRMPECSEEVKESLSLDPDDPEALALLGFCRYKQGHMDEGGYLIDLAYKKDRHRPMTAYYMAYVLLYEGEKNKALEICRIAMLRHPKNRDLRLQMGIILDVMFNP